MTQLKTSLIIDLAGNLASRAQQFSSSLSRFSASGSRSMQMLSRSMGAAGRGLDVLGNKYTAMITGGGLALQVKQVGDLSERFTRLGIQANVGTEGMDALKKKIFEVSQAPDIRADPSEVTGAIEEIIEKTGDLKFAEGNIRNIGLAIRATGAQGKDIGGILAEFQKMGIVDPKQVLEALDILNVQGKAGAFTLQNLAALGPRVVTAYTSMGRGGVGAIREMGAALQVIRMGTGSSEMAATAFEAVMRTLSDNKKLKGLQDQGIQVFDPKALKEGKEILRPINELMVDIVKKTQGKKTNLSEIFDAEAIRAFNVAAAEYQKSGKSESLERFYNVQADGTETMKDSARAAKEFNAAITNLHTAWQQFASDNLTKPVQELADYLNKIDIGKTQRLIGGVTKLGLAVGALVVARKGWKAFQWGKEILTGGKRGGGLPGMGGLGGGANGPIPVYVVNKHLSMLPGQGWGMPTQGGTPMEGAKKAGGRVLEAVSKVPSFLPKSVMGYLAKAGRVGAALAAPVATTGGVVATGSVLAAGAAGYGIGSLSNRGAGKIFEKASGGKYQGKGAIGDWLYDFLHKDPLLLKGTQAAPAKTDVSGAIKIEISSAVPVKIRQMESKNKDVNFNVDRGLMMASH